MQRFCKQDLRNLSKRIALHFQKTQKVVKSSKTVCQGLACSPNKLFKNLYWVRQTSARRWRVRSCCCVEQGDLKSCWNLGCSFSLGLFCYLILWYFFSSWIFEFTVTAVSSLSAFLHFSSCKVLWHVFSLNAVISLEFWAEIMQLWHIRSQPWDHRYWTVWTGEVRRVGQSLFRCFSIVAETWFCYTGDVLMGFLVKPVQWNWKNKSVEADPFFLRNKLSWSLNLFWLRLSYK